MSAMTTTTSPVALPHSPAFLASLRANPDQSTRLLHEMDRAVYLLRVASQAETERVACACLAAVAESLMAAMGCMVALTREQPQTDAVAC